MSAQLQQSLWRIRNHRSPQAELENALAKAGDRQPNDSAISIENLLNHINKKEYRSRFLLPYRDGFKTVFTSDVEFIWSEHRISKARLSNGTDETLGQSLEELEQQLDPQLFFRANRQFIVNIHAIRQIHNHFNGKIKIELKKEPTAEIIVSRDKALAIKSWMDF